MGARQKLNKTYFAGSFLLAALAGAATDSWIVFGAAFVGLLVSNVCLGDIRPRRSRS